MNRIQAIDAANVLMHIRPDWQQAGIIAVLLQLDLTYPAAVLHAIRVATNPNSRNPGAIVATPTTVERPPMSTHTDMTPRLDEPPEVTLERAHRGANLARAALGIVDQPSRDEPWLPPDLAAESATRQQTDQHQPEEAPTS